jgi:hypothetical protein
VAVHARIDAPGGALPVFTTHLTYGPGLSQVRTVQARALAQFVAGHAADCDYPPVSTGDLNAEPGSDELRLLGGLLTSPAVPGLVLIDAWRYANPGEPGFTWDHRNGYQDDSVIVDSRIGYILVGLPRQGRGRVRFVQLAGTAQSTAPGHRIILPSWPTSSRTGTAVTGLQSALLNAGLLNNATTQIPDPRDYP